MSSRTRFYITLQYMYMPFIMPCQPAGKDKKGGETGKMQNVDIYDRVGARTLQTYKTSTGQPPRASRASLVCELTARRGAEAGRGSAAV